MVSVTIPPLASLKWPSALKISNEIPANFQAIITLYLQFSAFLRSYSGASIISCIIYSAGTFLAITLPACVYLYSNRKKKINQSVICAANFESEVNDDSSENLPMGTMDVDDFSQGIVSEIVGAGDAVSADEFATKDAVYAQGIVEKIVCTGDAVSANEFVTNNADYAQGMVNEIVGAGNDADYAEEIQFQESLLASIFTSEIANNPSPSVQAPIFNTKLSNLEKEPESPSVSFCEICLENKENWKMFMNDKCSHSFCYDCTTSHIVTKIQDKVKEIVCPSLNCKAVLNFEACRLMIPDDTLVQWDELLCLALIPESQKLYCPFRDCLAMLVNDSGAVVREIQCLLCKRSFCADCHVPWHSDFTCKEFQKLYAKRGGKQDKIVKLLAKKKKWQKCPRCKMYVEKSEGCVHVTCRCKYEFCYKCGGKWSDSHGNCRPKS